MRLSGLSDTYRGAPDPEIVGITADSRKVRRGWLFAALPGAKADGAQYIVDAVSNGAAAIVGLPDLRVPPGIAFITDSNPRRAVSLMAARFYARQPEMIAAVTGTNGKTSTAHFTQQLWEASGHKSASLGTLGVRGAGLDKAGSLTTPDPVALHEEMAGLAAAGVTHLAMEASSHGLHQYRLDGVRMKAAGYTNLSRDHLDYHGTMEDYFTAKARLFSDILPQDGAAVLNADVPEYAELRGLCAERGMRVCGYGRGGDGIKLLHRTALPHGQELMIETGGRKYDLTLPLVGPFMAMNALCALGLAAEGAFENMERYVMALANLRGAPGRLQLVTGHPAGAAVYVDYAHTPDALENILAALRPHTAGRLVCLVGCGGDRDPGKRPIMGGIAARLADIAIITDDNPRSEEPAKIRAAMMAAAPGAKEIGGRREAIRWAMAQLHEGDVLVLAGKGHEQGQIIGSRVEPFDDIDEARKAIEQIKGRAA